MQLIIGLGNPGKQYLNTRHNAGFLALHFLRSSLDFENFHQEPRFQAELSIGTASGHKLILVKPTTFMNHSGRSVRLLLDFYKLTPADILVLHDDLDIPLGAFKLTHSSRAAGHHGVENIIEHLGTQDFRRIRLGIGRPTDQSTGEIEAPQCHSIHDYVLQNFSLNELALLEGVFPQLLPLLPRPRER